MIVGLDESLLQQIEYAIGDVQDEKGLNGYNFDNLKNGFERYIQGEFNIAIHDFIKGNRHMFIVYEGLYYHLNKQYKIYEQQQ